MLARQEDNDPLRIIFLVCLVLVGAAVVFCWFILTPPVLAQPQEVEKRLQPLEVTEGSLLLRTGKRDSLLPTPVLKTDVEIKITGLIVRAIVQQRFQNPGSDGRKASTFFRCRKPQPWIICVCKSVNV